VKENKSPEPQQEANQTVRLEIDATGGPSSIRIGFTDQRLSAHGGMVVWSHFLRQKHFRKELEQRLPHRPCSPNAYQPSDIALGFVGGVLAGADKLSRVAWLAGDPAISEVLGIEAIPSQSSLSRFFGVFTQSANNLLGSLHRWAVDQLPSRNEGYTLDLDSWALLHEDGHQEGVAVGYTRRGPKPCHRPLVAALAEAQMIAGYWLRSGDTSCANGAAEFLRQTVQDLPHHIRIGLVRADSGFSHASVLESAEKQGLRYIMAARLTQPVQALCRHTDAQWQETDVPGLQVQEIELEQPGRRLVVIRQRIESRPQAGGKLLIEVPGYRFQALITNLPPTQKALLVWRRYNGRADIENRIKELGDQFGIRRLACDGFWATEAIHHLVIAAYNLCVLLQRRLGQMEHCQLQTLRWRLFTCAAVWSRTRGKPTLRMATRGHAQRAWWCEILAKLTGPPNCNAVASLSA
jgi:Transposase DDE domain group 1